MRRAAILCAALFARTAAAEPCVVMLHGLGRSATSLWLLEYRLTEAGFFTVNETYSSTDTPLPDLIAATPPPRVAACAARRPIHFVTHSMGGIIIRGHLATHEVEGLGRVVMLAPPNQGSELIDAFRDIPGFDWLTGPAGLALGAEGESAPKQIADGAAEFGVIAGDLTLNPAFSAIIPGPDDGKVAVDATRFAAMTDHITLSVSHTFMMNDAEVARQTIHFLHTGGFDHDEEGAAHGDGSDAARSD